MDRVACVNLPVFPVQLLLQRHPDWRKQPVAVVDADKPQGTILWVNDRARSFKILPGMRYAAGLSLTGSLRASIVSKSDIEKGISSVSKHLRSFSPRIEPAEDEPGIFWIDASGLTRLFTSLTRWARDIHSEMNRTGFRTTVVVGFKRFGVYALAKSQKGVIVLKDSEEERISATRVQLDCLNMATDTRDMLIKLGITTVGQFIGLPAETIAKRFGWAAQRMHRVASGGLRLPFQPEEVQAPAVQRMVLDYTENDIKRILAVIQRLLNKWVREMSNRAEAVSEVYIRFYFEKIGSHTERVRPATPTVDTSQLFDLICLRLRSIERLPDGVVEVLLTGQGVPASPVQLPLTGTDPKRDLAAANRALARVRAELGEMTVVRARLRDGHLPEGQFTWEPIDNLTAPEPAPLSALQAVRRIFFRPDPFQPPRRRMPEKYLPPGSQQSQMASMSGPYVVSGGWWKRHVHREYYFTETQDGELLWVYDDRIRQRWYLQGRVE